MLQYLLPIYNNLRSPGSEEKKTDAQTFLFQTKIICELRTKLCRLSIYENVQQNSLQKRGEKNDYWNSGLQDIFGALKMQCSRHSPIQPIRLLTFTTLLYYSLSSSDDIWQLQYCSIIIGTYYSLVKPGSMNTSNCRLHVKKHSAGVRNVHFLYPPICVCHDGCPTLSIWRCGIRDVCPFPITNIRNNKM